MVFSYWFVLSYKNIKKIFTFWHTCLLFILKNACYSETKYYLCKQNNKRSLLGRKQRSRVARSFPNRYLFGLCDKVTSLFSTSCILDIILPCNLYRFTAQFACFLIAITRCLRQQVVGRERCFVDRPEQTRAVSRGILRGFVEQTNVVPAFSFEQKLAHTLL